MSTYHMASMHGKWSKQVNLPMGDKWGVPQGTSVADCLNWSHGVTRKPASDYSHTEPDVQVRDYWSGEKQLKACTSLLCTL